MKRVGMSRQKLGRFVGVVFDLDGTLTHPGAIDFAAIRQRCGMPPDADIVASLAVMPDAARLRAIVEEEEEFGLQRQSLRHDCVDMLAALDRVGFKRALHTRNNDDAMMRTLRLLDDADDAAGFSILLSRSFLPSKPHPDGILHISRAWQCEPRELVMVGDSADDMIAGRRAGARTVLIEHHLPYFEQARLHADHVVKSLMDLVPLLVALNESAAALEGDAAV